MQLDMESDVTLILQNLWEKMGRLKLRKYNLYLKQFDGTVIKVMDTFEGTFESKNASK